MATTQTVLEAALSHAAANRQRDLDDYLEELRIPSVSTLPERREDCLRNAKWLRDRFQKMGMTAEVVDDDQGGLPVVTAEWKGQPGKPHLTIYGHYDVQPPDPLDEWKTPPFEPDIRDGRVFARGSADNKGNHMVALKAAEHLFAAGGPPINLRFILEGEEEISGTALPRFLHARGKGLKTDAVLIWDGGMDIGDTPALCTALRGILYTELHASGPAIDLHSGTYGGVAPNPILSLARVLGELKDRDGRITIPGFYDDIADPTPQELAEWKKRDDEFAQAFKQDMGVQTLEGEPGFVTRERAGSRPTQDAHGIIGGFTGKGEKTVIPARASAKVSMRLVPNQDWRKIFASLEKYVERLTTPGVQIKVELLGAAPPVLCDVNHRAAKALESAYQETFGKQTAFVRAGGSIPVAVDFRDAVGAPLVISGVSQADEGAHSPNERMVVDNYHRGIEAVIRFICHLAERP